MNRRRSDSGRAPARRPARDAARCPKSPPEPSRRARSFSAACPVVTISGGSPSRPVPSWHGIGPSEQDGILAGRRVAARVEQGEEPPREADDLVALPVAHRSLQSSALSGVTRRTPPRDDQSVPRRPGGAVPECDAATVVREHAALRGRAERALRRLGRGAGYSCPDYDAKRSPRQASRPTGGAGEGE